MHFHCDINFDPFVFMHENNKTYGSFLSCLASRTPTSTPLNLGFALAVYDDQRTIESLWSNVTGTLDLLLRTDLHGSCSLPRVDFIDQHPEYVVPNNAMNFLSDDGGAKYNLCLCMVFSFPGPQTKEEAER